ncbi:DUF6526 family protein [Chryseolinea sp. T2]|uniref:DUF6526 family protein n=1 Tax=Chryseolinea sp. T2 TaxID=3129255 RepID=UPI0030771FD6
MSKVKQEYSNHRHLVPSFHFLTLGALVVLLIGSVVYLFVASPWLLALLIIVMTLAITSIGLHARSFAIRAQDRAIRAEENLRYFILTGQRLNQSLSLPQIIALRFASDEEFVALTARALEQNMKPDEIKRAVKNWRPDYHRV